jgi:pyruvate dehydrogenase E1 component alpha subunit/2-oxoisovalerate dehydrogenase E1 component alpha subunit
MTGHTLDGTRLEACLTTLGDAMNRARRGEGPQLVEARLLRLCGHGEHDDASYIDPELKASPVGRDCLMEAQDQAVTRGWLSREELERWRSEMTSRVEEAVAQVQREPGPDPFKEDWRALATANLAEGSTEPA